MFERSVLLRYIIKNNLIKLNLCRSEMVIRGDSSARFPSGESRYDSVDKIPFSELATLYADLRKAKTDRKRTHAFIQQKKGDSRRTILTRTWLRLAELCGSGAAVLSSRKTDVDLVPAQLFHPEHGVKLISLVVPVLDSAHAYMGMKESKLADGFIRALDLVPRGEDAQWLKNYREKEYRPRKWKQDATIVDGNFATVLRAVLTGRCPKESTLTIGAVWNVLNTLSQVSRGRRRLIERVREESAEQSSREAKVEAVSRNLKDEPEEKRAGALRTLISKGTAEEVSEVARIVLKDLEIGMSEENFLNWFHPGAKQHYTQIHDIKRLLADCFNPKFEIGDAAVQVGQYASVMLTMRPSRKNIQTICQKLRGGVAASGSQEKIEIEETENGRPYFIMEPKLDGERLQLHKWKRKSEDGSTDTYEIRTFSRRGNDSSAMYAGALTEVVLSAVMAEDVILDGEIMIWDELKACWLRFEDYREVSTAIAKKSVPEGAAYTLKYMVFDILYVDQGEKRGGSSKRNGNMVIRLPLHQRRALLEKLIKSHEVKYGPGARAQIEVVGMERGHDEKELTQTLQRFETLGYEGVIAKHPDMPYVLAERSLDISIKLKPDYFDGGIQDLDVLILGARYSTSSGHRSQRAGNLSSFLIGVRAPEGANPKWKLHGKEWEDKMQQSKWVPVGSVGTGYSDKELERLRKECKGEWQDFDGKDLPEHFDRREYAPNMLSDIAKWIPPWKSIVLTVRAYEMNRGYNALRFPRVERINWEKPYYDVPTLTQLLDLDENKLPAFVRQDEDDLDDVSGAGPTKKKKRSGLDSDEEQALLRAKEEGHIVTRGRSGRGVISSAVGTDVGNVDVLSNALKGLSFFVVAHDPQSKEDIEVKIHQLGGRFVQSLDNSVDFAICSKSDLLQVKRLKQRFSEAKHDMGKCSILESEWIDECHKKQAKTSPAFHVVFASKSLQTELYRDVDRFGDPWIRDVDGEEVSKALKEVLRWKSRNLDEMPTKRVDEIDSKVCQAMTLSGNVFKNVRIYVPSNSDALNGAIALLRAFGGRLIRQEGQSVTHVLVHSSARSRDEKNLVGSSAQIVTEKWVRHCVEAGALLNVGL